MLVFNLISPFYVVQYPSPGNGATYSRLGLSTWINPIKITPHWHAQTFVSRIILGLIKLTMTINHHNSPPFNLIPKHFTF